MGFFEQARNEIEKLNLKDMTAVQAVQVCSCGAVLLVLA
jgi:hypothetical protein